jgi:hypothetical protein
MSKQPITLPAGREAHCPICHQPCALWLRLARLRYSTRELKQLMQRFHLPVCALCGMRHVLIDGDTCEHCHPRKLYSEKAEPSHAKLTRGGLRSAGWAFLFKGW